MLELHSIHEKKLFKSPGRKKIIGWYIKLFSEENITNNFSFPSKEQHQLHADEFLLFFPEIKEWLEQIPNFELKTQLRHSYFYSGTYTDVFLVFNKKQHATKFLNQWFDFLELFLPLFKRRCGINCNSITSKYINPFYISPYVDVRQSIIDDFLPYTVKFKKVDYEWFQKHIKHPFMQRNNVCYFRNKQDAFNFKMINTAI